MKKRLLALCLAAALLLGMMPALTLSTNAAESVSTTQTQYVGSGSIVGTGSPSPTFSSTTLVRLKSDSRWSMEAGTWPRWSKLEGTDEFYLDHTKDILFTENIQINAVGLPQTDGAITVAEDGVMTYSGAMMELMDGDSNSIIYLLLYRNLSGNFCINVLKADKTVATLDTGINTATSFTLQVLWAINGSVTVTVGSASVTAENATITRDATAAKGTFTNPDRQTAVCEDDYIEWNLFYKDTEWNQSNNMYASSTNYWGTQVLFYEFYVTHTEYLPIEMDSYFTSEVLDANGALTEASWKYASYTNVGGYQTAVLASKGTAYVALKGANGDVSVKLGNATKTATVANGVAEIAFENAVSAYDATADLTVGTETATVTFAKKAVNLENTGTNTVNLQPTSNFYINGSVGTSSTGRTGGFWWRLLTSGATETQIRVIFNGNANWSKTGADGDIIADRSQFVKFNLIGTVQSGSYAALDKGAITVTDNKLAKSGSNNMLVYTLKDYESGDFIYAYLTADASQDMYVGFFMPDQTNHYVALTGVNNAGTAGTNDDDLSSLYLIWNPDGSVSVEYGGTVLETVAGATWTADATAAVGTAANPSMDGTNATEADYLRIDTMVASSNTANSYLTTALTFSATPAATAITTNLADDLVAAIEDAIDTDNLVFLPAVVEHPYLGDVALTWSDDQSLVVDGVVKTPDATKTTNLTAKVGDEVIWTGTATVKAAEPVYAMFAANASLVWNNAIFTQLKNSTDSVAVLAENRNLVYVAVKGADGAATVTLGGVEKAVTIEDGMGVIAFENVALNAYGEERTILVTTATGTLETKVVFQTKQIVMPTVDLNNANLRDYSALAAAVYFNGEEQYPRIRLYNGRNNGYIGIYGKADVDGDIDIDRSDDVTINLSLGVQDDFFSGDASSLGVTSSWALQVNNPNVIYFILKDYETSTFFYPYLTADAEKNLKLGFLLQNNATADQADYLNTYVDLGLNVAGVDPDAVGETAVNLNLVWHTDGSVTVKLGDEVMGTVADATWTVNANSLPNTNPGRIENPAISSGTAVTTDFLYMGVSGTADHLTDRQAKLYAMTVANKVPAKVEDIELHNNDVYSLDLGSDIGFNFYVAENPGATITVNAAGEETIYNASDLTATDGFYLIEANVAAAQMTEDVSVKIVDAYGMTVFDATTTAKAYADALLADGNTKDDALVNAMLNYGGAAQKYFDHKIDSLASETAPSNALLSETVADYTATQSGAVDGITVKSASLCLQEKVVIRYYFNAASVDGMTFKCGDKVLTAEQKSEGVWYVDVEVNPQNMGTTYTVTVNDALTVNYSCMTYMTKYAADVDLGELLCAMYDYYQAAVDYLAN